jgi:hypothetical protein
VSQAELRQALEELRAEVDTLAGDKIAARNHLNALINDLEDRIEHLDDLHPKHRAILLERVRAGIKQVEVEHPTLTALLNRILVALSSMGI